MGARSSTTGADRPRKRRWRFVPPPLALAVALGIGVVTLDAAGASARPGGAQNDSGSGGFSGGRGGGFHLSGGSGRDRGGGVHPRTPLILVPAVRTALFVGVAIRGRAADAHRGDAVDDLEADERDASSGA